MNIPYVGNVVVIDKYFTDKNVFVPNQNASSKKYHSFMIPKRSSASITLAKQIAEREKREKREKRECDNHNPDSES